MGDFFAPLIDAIAKIAYDKNVPRMRVMLGGNVRYYLFVQNRNRVEKDRKKSTIILADDRMMIDVRKGTLKLFRDGVPIVLMPSGETEIGNESVQVKFQFNDRALTEEDALSVALLVASLTWYDVIEVDSGDPYQRWFKFVPGSVDRVRINETDLIEVNTIKGQFGVVRTHGTVVLCQFHSLFHDEMFGILELISALANVHLEFRDEDRGIIRYVALSKAPVAEIYNALLCRDKPLVRLEDFFPAYPGKKQRRRRKKLVGLEERKLLGNGRKSVDAPGEPVVGYHSTNVYPLLRKRESFGERRLRKSG